jgi:hypothetical protein
MKRASKLFRTPIHVDDWQCWLKALMCKLGDKTIILAMLLMQRWS